MSTIRRTTVTDEDIAACIAAGHKAAQAGRIEITGGTDNGDRFAKMLRETALEGDFGDDGKPVIVVDTTFDRHDELRATLAAAGREDRVVVVGAGNLGVGLAAALRAQGVLVLEPGEPALRTVGTKSRQLGRNPVRQLALTAIAAGLGLGSTLPRRVTINPNFAAPYGKACNQTPADVAALAAAQAKRDRRAAKKGKS